MKHLPSLSRRRVLGGLSGLAGTSAFLPLLEATDARAAAGSYPLRLLVIVWPDGVIGGDTFFPPLTKPDGALVIDKAHPQLAPLIPFASRLSMFGGLIFQTQLDSGSSSGHQSTPWLLTGKKGVPFEGTWDGVKNTAAGPSIDQYIANQLRATGIVTRFRSLVTRVSPGKGNGGSASVFGPPIANKYNAPIPEHDTTKLFETLFVDPSGVGVTPEEAARRRQAGKSVLDYLSRNLSRIGRAASADDRAKLEAHLAAVQELDRQLTASGKSGCVAPPAASVGSDLNGKVRVISKTLSQLTDLTAAAFSCDLVRTAVIHWEGPWDFAFPAPGEIVLNDGAAAGPFINEHTVAHEAPGSRAAVERKLLIDRWFHARFAETLARLDAVKEGDGTLLDHTVVLFANNMGDGASHYIGDVPWLVAGGAGVIKPGQVLRGPRGDKFRKLMPHVRLLRSLVSGFGFSADAFSDPTYGDDLSGVLV